MADKSPIEWTEATWNPVTGCDKVSPGCAHCYAERMAKRLKAMGQVWPSSSGNGVACSRARPVASWKAGPGIRCPVNRAWRGRFGRAGKPCQIRQVLRLLEMTPERRLEVSGRLRDDFQNGRSYYPLHGQAVSLPSAEQDHPQLEFLRWHNETVYNGLA